MRYIPARTERARRLSLLSLSLLLLLPFSLLSQETDEKSEEKRDDLEIEIVAARDLQSFTLESTDEDYVRISGGVILTVTDHKDDEVHHIEAESITINQETDLITAKGNVVYREGEEGSKNDKFSGESLTVYLDPWKGVIFNVTSYTENTPEDGGDPTSFRYTAKKLRSGEEGVVILEDATITSSDRAEPYYRIKIKKMWLLGVGEWGVTFPTLYVGEVPLFWFPFFYQPGNDIVFNPVVGTYSREGPYIQTTTYFFGRKKEEAEGGLSFLSSISNDSNYTTKLKGLYLFKTAKKDYTPPKNYLKVLADYYVKLGYFGGLEGFYAPQKSSDWLSSVEFKFGVGRSRSIDSNNKVVYSSTDGSSFWNSVSYKNQDLPIRFGVEFSFTNRWLSILLGHYSDPYFRRDFYYRKESYNWISHLTNRVEEVTDERPDPDTSFDWEFKINPQNIPTGVLSPYLKNFSITQLFLTLNWEQTLNTTLAAEDPFTPTRYFFYPKDLKAPLNLSLSGTFIDTTSIGSSEEVESSAEIESVPETGFALGAENEEAANSSGRGSLNEKDLPGELLNVDSAGGDLFGSYKLSYEIKNGYDVEAETGNTTKTTTGGTITTTAPSDPAGISFDFREINFKTNSTFSFFQNASLIYGYLQVQNNTVMNLDTEENTYFSDRLASESDTPKTGQDFLVQNTLTSNVYPLKEFSFWSASTLGYSLSMDLYQLRKGINAQGIDEPIVNPEWTDDSVTSHTFQANLLFNNSLFNVGNAFTANLPPKDPEYITRPTGSLSFADFTFGADTQISYIPFKASENIKERPADYQQYRFSNLNLRTNYAPFDGKLTLSADASLDYNLVKNLTSFNTGLTAWGAYVRYGMLYTQPVEWTGAAFSRKGASKLLPSTVSVGYKDDLLFENLWKNRIDLTLKIETDWTQVLTEFTNSKLSFGLGFDLDIYQFLVFSFNIRSSNNSMFLYFDEYRKQLGIEKNYNFFTDLFQSFNFGNTGKREESFFNLDQIDIALIHKMGEWDLSFNYKGFITLEGVSNYKWTNTFSVAIAWNPIPELNSKFSKDEDNVYKLESFKTDKTDK